MNGDKTIYRLMLGLVAAAVFAGGVWLFTRSNDDRAPADPYEVYVEAMPEPPAGWAAEWPMSREDAQARALLGCGQDWAPGTVDAVLQEAYDPDC